GIAILIVGLSAAGWLLWTFMLRSNEIGWRSDGIIVEVTKLRDLPSPRAEVTTVAAGNESYPWAFAPLDSGNGECRDPRFRILKMPERGRVYSEGDQLSIEIEYSASGCADIRANFDGRFVEGSPFFELRCAEQDAVFRDRLCRNYFEGRLGSSTRALDVRQVVIALSADPSLSPPHDASSPRPPGVPRSQSLEGFRLCSVELIVSDSTQGGSRSSQEVFVGCFDALDFPF
ncbi:MAG TPA: hypothetical protein VGB13_05920, partial [Candidatus Krumholzibacteria bacterium]